MQSTVACALPLASGAVAVAVVVAPVVNDFSFFSYITYEMCIRCPDKNAAH